MARESKKEIEIREEVTRNLAPGETLRDFSWATKEGTMSAAYFFFGILGTALAGQNKLGYFIGLTDKRFILVEVNGQTPTGEVHSISISDIKGLKYRSSGSTGNLQVHLSADVLQLIFDKRPWWGRAKNMAKLMPLPK